MKNTIMTSIVLFLICAVCAVLCASVNYITAPRIEENIRIANAEALKSVAGDLEIGETVEVTGFEGVKESTELYKDGKKAGTALLLSGSGYGGSFSIIAAYDNNGALMGAKMTVDSETAGLGKKAEESLYMDLFKGMGNGISVPSAPKDLPGEQAALVSGATVTFKGVTKALGNGSVYIKEGAK